MTEVHILFFFNDTATTEIYTLSLHDALPISEPDDLGWLLDIGVDVVGGGIINSPTRSTREREDRKSTRLNSSHSQISYAVFCLKKKIRICIACRRREAVHRRIVKSARSHT